MTVAPFDLPSTLDEGEVLVPRKGSALEALQKRTVEVIVPIYRHEINTRTLILIRFGLKGAQATPAKGRSGKKGLSRAARQVWVKKPDRSGQYRWIPDDGKNAPELDSEPPFAAHCFQNLLGFWSCDPPNTFSLFTNTLIG